MKATKLNDNAKILFKFFWIVCITLMVFSCDVLESDPDVLEPKADIMGKEVFVLANNASFIDLNTKLQTNVPARIAVTSETRRGKLTDLGKGILQYSPSTGTAKARDGFEFTVYSTNNEIIKRDSVIIIIENDSTNLPCNIYPVPDYVYGVNDTPVLIEVTHNDIICSGSVVVSIYKPSNSFPPYNGQAEVQGNKIKYSPGSGFDGADEIMYKLTVANDTFHVAYGIVYITGDSSCSFRLSNDAYVFGEHALDSVIHLPVFNNDSLCQSSSQYQVNLKSQAQYGRASSADNGFLYKVPASVTFPFVDFFEYEVCIDAACKTSRVDIKLKKDSVIACVVQARLDSIGIAYNDLQLQYLDVLQNDSICGDLKSFKITQAPSYGTSSVSNRLIIYQRNSSQENDDVLKYEICNSVECSTATVIVKHTK